MPGAARWCTAASVPAHTQAAAAPPPPPPLPPTTPAAAPAALQVISNRMQKSVLVAVDRLVTLKKYDKTIRRTTKLMVGVCVGRSGVAGGGGMGAGDERWARLAWWGTSVAV